MCENGRCFSFSLRLGRKFMPFSSEIFYFLMIESAQEVYQVTGNRVLPLFYGVREDS